ncbi:thiol reductant ABC exporter subunit CydC [Skermania sp. ID1734]|uniref:thiol reductant ABC exporter subunit CydC n=1 Tax=Skermania sp. ID1734 TaxID=2597516 RepID=UPI00117E0053|nr:thiol reductant ABC exporter subunit CydC [Skermania sp. ID1734]TSD96551.1 thiol reductant ABC exporter subunit CydC [Skermania sp. ID1734]
MTRGPLLDAIRLLRPTPARTLAAIGAGVAASGSALALAVLSAWLIARAWQMPPVLDLSVAVVAVRALGISRGVFRYLERLATHAVALRGMAHARAEIYRRLAAGQPSAVTALRRGDLLARTGTEIDTIGAVIVRGLVPIVVAVTIGLSAVVALSFVSLWAAVVLAFSLLVAGFVAPVLGARAGTLAEQETIEFNGEYTAHALTVLGNTDELRVAGTFDTAVDQARRAAHASVHAEARAASKAAHAAAAGPLALAVSVIGALFIGVSMAQASAPTSLAVLVLLPLAAFEATGPLTEAAAAIVRARVSARRIMALLDGAGHSQVGGTSEVPADLTLSAQSLRFGWTHERCAGPTDLVVVPGARIAIVGPSGAGKTSLLMTLAGLLAPRHGEVRLGERLLNELDPHELRRVVTFFSEDAHIFSTTVLENLRVGNGGVSADEARRALAAVGLGDWLGLDDGLDTVLVGGDRAVSGGQRRRLLLARALLAPAPILLLDEPTEHLDAEEGAAILTALLDRNSGLIAPDRSVVVVTHQLPAVHSADSVLELASDLPGEKSIARSLDRAYRRHYTRKEVVWS